MTRRNLLGAAAAAAAAQAAGQAQRAVHQNVEWKPRLGILGPYSEANLKFAHDEGFTNMILSAPRKPAPGGATFGDVPIDSVKQTLAKYEMHVSALQASMNHIEADATRRKTNNDNFVSLIEIAGKLGIPYIGTSSGKDGDRPFQKQVDDIVKVYTERYFPACQANKVRILWEPYPSPANLAISPAGFEALFKGFGDSPYVGLQYDPSHLVRGMMDPIQTARDFVDKIYDVHLKDTEIRWDILHRVGIEPVDGTKWWWYRLPGLGSIAWSEFFSVLQRAGYQGAMSLEHEDPLYGSPNRPGPDFSPEYAMGFKMAHRYLRQYVPE